MTQLTIFQEKLLKIRIESYFLLSFSATYRNLPFKLSFLWQESCQGDLVVDNNPPCCQGELVVGGEYPPLEPPVVWLGQLIFQVSVMCRVSRAVQWLKCVNITFDLHSHTPPPQQSTHKVASEGTIIHGYSKWKPENHTACWRIFTKNSSKKELPH